MSEESPKPRGNLIARARLNLAEGGDAQTEYFLEFPNGDLQPISKEDALRIITESSTATISAPGSQLPSPLARVIEFILKYGAERRDASRKNDEAKPEQP